MMTAGVLTLSDKGSQGLREDVSGSVIQEILTQHGITTGQYAVIPDDEPTIAETLRQWCDNSNLSLIVTTGGTGLSPRDVTPEATLAVIEKRVPGMEEVMRAESLKKTPHAMISRAVVGVRGSTLIINLPGSPRAARECLMAVVPALGHALEKLGGDTRDCAQ